MTMDAAAIIWLLEERELVRVNQAEVLNAVPVLKPHILQNWVNRGIVKSLNEHPGKSGNREYSGSTVLAISVTATLSSLGISASLAAKMAQDLFAVFETEVRPRDRKKVAMRLFNTSTIIVATSKIPGLIYRHVMSGEDVWVVAKRLGLSAQHALLILPSGRIFENVATSLAATACVDLKFYAPSKPGLKRA